METNQYPTFNFLDVIRPATYQINVENLPYAF